jgi:hypothetical protein
MNSVVHTSNQAAAPLPPPTPKTEVRHAVRDLLLSSQSFSKLSPDKQRQIAHDMAQIADYLASPEGIPGNRLPGAASLAVPGASALDDTPDDSQKGTSFADASKAVDKIGRGKFKASAAREGAEVAGMLLQKVNFPDFCAQLITGVFHAIVTASIEQMEAYGRLVASVAQSLNQFRDDNVTDNQGRDHLVEQFPDIFQIGMGDTGDPFGGGGGGPRLQLRDGVDEDSALQRINSRLPMDGGPLKSLDPEDPDNESQLVQGARTQLATSRQQLLATMVLMGINRIVVTDGKIQAKILYDFQARDNMRRQRSAAAFDYARDKSGQVQTTWSGEGTYDTRQEGEQTTESHDKDSSEYDHRDANYYTKGTYKFAQQPMMTAMSTASETTDAALQTKASLAGVVDINFKSDYFPLEKMADSFQIAQIQNASKPPRTAPAGGGQPGGTAPATGAGAGTTPAQQTTAPAPAAAPATK